MRKSFMLFVVLLVLGISGMLYAHASLTAAQYDVTFTETASFGDVSAADGLTVSVQAHLAQRLVWDSAHYFGQSPHTSTGFVFSSKQLDWRTPYSMEELSISIASGFSSSSSGGILLEDPEGSNAFVQSFASVIEILRDVAARTNNGERRSEKVDIRDYYEFFPIYARFWSEQYNYYFINYSGDIRGISSSWDENGAREAFSSYFRIPVPDKFEITVEVQKDSAGNIVEISVTPDDSVWLGSTSVMTGSGVYFMLRSDGITDFSGVSGGYGIYLLPASTILDDEFSELPTLDYLDLSTVYPLDETASVWSFTLSEDGSCLNLITTEDRALFLTVIEIATMTEKQKLPLFEYTGDSGLHMPIYTNGLLFMMLGDARFVLAERNGDNTYRTVLTGTIDNELLNEELFARGYYRWWTDPVISWDGERLALVTVHQRFVDNDNDYPGSYSYVYDLCGFSLEVYDGSGLRYKGLYESSLDVLAAQDNYYGRCRIIDYGGLSLK